MPSDVTYSVSRDSNCSLWMVNGKNFSGTNQKYYEHKTNLTKNCSVWFVIRKTVTVYNLLLVDFVLLLIFTVVKCNLT